MNAFSFQQCCAPNVSAPAPPKRVALARYGDRIAEVLGEARGERVMIRSLHAYGVERRSAVKWKNLRLLDDQLI